MFCQNCGTAAQGGDRCCRNCGAVLERGDYLAPQPTGQQSQPFQYQQPSYQQPVSRQSQSYAQPRQDYYPQRGYQQPPVVVNQTVYGGRVKNKWLAFWLCFFLGVLGVHKFYEEKILLGIVYLFTGGLFGIGWFIDLVVLLFKPNPYCV